MGFVRLVMHGLSAISVFSDLISVRILLAAGVSLTTLQNYLNGQPMKLDAAVALAKACNVTIEWLATGHDTQPAQKLAAPTPPAPLFQTVHMDMLAAAIAGATKVFAEQQRDPSGRPFAQIVCILYDEAKARIDSGEA